MTEHKSAGFLDRTLKNLKRGWQSIAGGAYDAAAASTRPDLPETDAERLLAQMRDCLENKGGEVSARARAASLGQVYLALDPSGREKFLSLMAQHFGVSGVSVDAAIGAYRRADSEDTRLAAETELRSSLEAPWTRLLTQFNALPDGVKFLVDMRAELIPLARKDAKLKPLESDLRSLLAGWFDVDFLELRQITWDSPASILEKLIAYEAVHAIDGWEDLKDRLDSDRRCFGYFHPRMPEEPLIFVEVALVNGIADNVQALIDQDAPVMDPTSADTAIFYSISNAQQGLAGISFGNFLIKRVVQQLQSEFPNLTTFSTLSPIPGFRKWLDETLAEGKAGSLSPTERKALTAAVGKGGAKGAIKSALELADWHQDEVISEALKGPLTRFCATYLSQAKGRGGRARDPVAHFHLTNGSRLERINWMGDRSEKGLKQSSGMMVNYLYDLSGIEDNHEAYRTSGEVVTSSGVKSLIKS